MIQVRAAPCFIWIACSLGGCAIPFPATERLMTGVPIEPASTAFLAARQTTMKDIRDHLGEPTFIWEDARLFVYQWNVRQGMFAWVLYPAPVGSVGEIPRRHAFVVRFDEEERVTAWGEAIWPLRQTLPEFLREWMRSDQSARIRLPAHENDVP